MTKSVENAAAESLIMQSQRANNWGGKTSKKQSTTNPTHRGFGSCLTLAPSWKAWQNLHQNTTSHSE